MPTRTRPLIALCPDGIWLDFGKYGGHRLADVPEDYLYWILREFAAAWSAEAAARAARAARAAWAAWAAAEAAWSATAARAATEAADNQRFDLIALADKALQVQP